MKSIVKRDIEKYSQICVWPATVVGHDKIKDFENFFKEEFQIDIKYLEEVKTLPDLDEDNEPVKDTGGRNDVFFAINQKDIPKFAHKRLNFGIRWIEDVMSNINGYNENPIYPEYIKDYITWDANKKMRQFNFDIDNHVDNYIIAREDDIEIQINVFDNDYEIIIEYDDGRELVEEDFENYKELKQFTDEKNFIIPTEDEIFEMLDIKKDKNDK